MEPLSLLSMIATLFVIIDPIGSIPTVAALTKNYDFVQQRRIILREVFLAFVLALFFQYLGAVFLDMLHIAPFAMRIAGGLLLMLVGLDMIFAISSPVQENAVNPKQEPFIFPIATPVLSGPGLLTVILLFSQTEKNPLKLTLAICITWIGVTAILAFAPYLQRILKKSGLTILEQIMGLILTFVAFEMLVQGTVMFMKTLKG